MKIELLLHDLARGEGKLACELERLAQRHRTDHEVWYLGQDLAGWSRAHAREIAALGRSRGMHLRQDPARVRHRPSRLRELSATAMGRRPEPAMLLLRDLRMTYLAASEVSVDWELVAQAAQAKRDQELLDLTQRCHPDALRQMRWANTLLKELSPQTLAA